MIGLTYQLPARATLLAGTVVIVAFALAVCGSMEQPAPAAQQGGSYVYVCPGDYRFAVQFRGDTALVSLPDEELQLPQVVAASGVRYAAGGVVLWTKGQEASLETQEGKHDGCRGQRVNSPWERSRLLGFEFRGVGQEPGWTIEIEPGRLIRLVLDYGESRYYLPAPKPVRQPDGALVYDISAEGVTARVVIVERSCRDAMSGEESTHVVTVTVDGKEYRGCGRILQTRSLLGTHWSLIELGGRPVITGADRAAPYIRLLRGEERMVGHTGCNNISGGYILDGAKLEFDRVVSTLRACVDPQVSRQEQEFTRALEATTRYSIRSDTLTLLRDTAPLARFEARYLR